MYKCDANTSEDVKRYATHPVRPFDRKPTPQPKYEWRQQHPEVPFH